MLRKITPYRIKKGILYLKHYGAKEFCIRLKERLWAETMDYKTWYETHKPTEEQLEKQRDKSFSFQPLISIVVPVYNTPEEYLRQMLVSVLCQTYANWELCIANASPSNEVVTKVLNEFVNMDARIRSITIPQNDGIAQNTNAAIRIAAGEYIGFLDHDDILAPDALYEVVKQLNEDNSYEVLYSDEDKVTEDLTEHFQPHIKPEFNLDLLRSNNYICHFCVIRKALIEQVGGLRKEFDGAQDYDLILRCVERARNIIRIPRILYHWRMHEQSTADNPISKRYAFEAGKHAIEEHLKRCGEMGEVFERKDLGFYRVKYPVMGNPLVSVIIPNKDHVEDLKKCLASIERNAYKNYEIILVENNSTKAETFAYYQQIESEQRRVVTWDGPFNYSAINHLGVTYAKGEYFLFLNNDVEAIRMDWIEELLGNCQRKNVGAVGAKLFFPDKRIQHAGIVIGIGGVAANMFAGIPGEYTGYMHKASIQQNYSAVTAACMMVSREVYEEVGGFTEELAVAFNDVDFCLKIREKGYIIVYNPEVQLYHYESKTRGPEDTKEKLERFQREIDVMKQRWSDILQQGDPMYSPNFSLKKCDYSLSEKRNGI